MARMKPRGTGEAGTGRTRGGKRRTEPSSETPSAVSEEKGAAPGMDRRARLLVVGLMGALLFLFLLIGALAPAPGDPGGSPQGTTVLYRLLFLLGPLGIMYGLLWGEKLLRLFKR
jgi:hypothetical protein